MHSLLAFVVQEGVFGKTSTAAAFDTACHTVENFDTFDWVFACGGFSGEHDGVCLFEDGVGYVGDFCASWDRIHDHRFEHVGSDDDWAAMFEAALDDAPLDDWKVFHGAFDPQIAACHHDRIGFADDFIEVPDGELILNFGDNMRLTSVAFEDLAEDVDIIAFSAKREGYEVDAHFCAEGNICEILFGQRREVHLDAGEINVAPGAHNSLRENLTANTVALFGEDLHVNHTVVDQNGVPFGDIIDQSIVVYIDRVDFFTPFASNGEFENITVFKFQFCRQITGADCRALRIHQDAHLAMELVGDETDAWDEGAHPVVGGMAHIQPEDVGAGFHQSVEGFLRLCGRAQCGYNLCFAHDREEMFGDWAEVENLDLRALDQLDFVALWSIYEGDDAPGRGLGWTV